VIQVPSQATLRKYGLSENDWKKLLEEQESVCFVCKQTPSSNRLCVDHEHVRGWKKLPPEKRKLYVRGLLCWRCNTTFVGRGITIERATNVAAYLQRYQQRRPVLPS
jgi:hypothetical protein